MARLVIVLDLDDVDPLDTDPHTAADDVLDLARDTFVAGASFRTETTDTRGVFVSAEWTP